MKHRALEEQGYRHLEFVPVRAHRFVRADLYGAPRAHSLAVPRPLDLEQSPVGRTRCQGTRSPLQLVINGKTQISTACGVGTIRQFMSIMPPAVHVDYDCRSRRLWPQFTHMSIMTVVHVH